MTNRPTVLALLRYSIFPLLGLLTLPVQAITAANTLISNQATASYIDADGIERLVSSNAVRTRVQTVVSFNLLQDNLKQGLPGTTLYFSHTVVNTGNNDDSYALRHESQAGNAFTFASVRMFADEDANGIADNADALSETPIVTMGSTYTFVVEVTIPTNALTDTEASVLISLSSLQDTALQQQNIDTVQLVDDAIMEVTQSIEQTEGQAGSGPYIIRFDYLNRGTRAATDVTLRNKLHTAFRYQDNSGQWSQGNTSLTDANEEEQGQEPSIIYCAYDNASCDENNALNLTISEVGAGQSGSLYFSVNISNRAIPGTYFNEPTYSYTTYNGSRESSVRMNPIPFTVTAQQGLELTDAESINVVPGTTVFLLHSLINMGNRHDTFNLMVSDITSNFPQGTTFFFYQDDGVTPLTDTNLDSIVDSAAVPAGQSLDFFLAITLPSDTPTGDYRIPVQAKSIRPDGIQAEAQARVTVLAEAVSVDVTAIAASGDSGCESVTDACGFGAFNATEEAAITVSSNPDETVELWFYIRNLSTVADTFDLTLFNDASNQQVTSDIRTQFQLSDGSITASSGTLTAGSAIAIKAILTLPSGMMPIENRHFYLRASSQSSGQSDQIQLALTVRPVERLVFSPDYQVTEKPDSQGVYKHTLRNTGNTTVIIDTIEQSNADNSPWTTVLYEDTPGGNVDDWDAVDEPYQGVKTLTPGDTLTLFLWVSIPSNAASGTTQQIDLTAYYNNHTQRLNVVDVITVNPYDIDIEKLQAHDQACDGREDNQFSPYVFLAEPGECIIYQIVVTNKTDLTARNALIDDATPDFTRYSHTQPIVRCQPDVCVFNKEPDANARGAIEVAIGDLVNGAEVMFYFSVKVDDQ